MHFAKATKCATKISTCRECSWLSSKVKRWLLWVQSMIRTLKICITRTKCMFTPNSLARRSMFVWESSSGSIDMTFNFQSKVRLLSSSCLSKKAQISWLLLTFWSISWFIRLMKVSCRGSWQSSMKLKLKMRLQKLNRKRRNTPHVILLLSQQAFTTSWCSRSTSIDDLSLLLINLS